LNAEMCIASVLPSTLESDTTTLKAVLREVFNTLTCLGA
jgi:hypothetical protein